MDHMCIQTRTVHTVWCISIGFDETKTRIRNQKDFMLKYFKDKNSVIAMFHTMCLQFDTFTYM